MKPVITIAVDTVPPGVGVAQLINYLQDEGFTVVLAEDVQKVVVHPDVPSQRERIATALLAARIASGICEFWAQECERAVVRADLLIKELNK